MQVFRPAREGRGGDALAADGQGEPAGARLDQLPGDVQVVAEALVQDAADLAQGDAGLGHLDLDVRSPGAARAELFIHRPGGGLQLLQGVEHTGGGHLTGDAAGRKDRRRLEGVDHHLTRGEGVIDHHHDAQGDHANDQGQEGLHADPDPLAGAADPALTVLVDQMRQPERALLCQLLGLQVDESGLAPQEMLCRAGHPGIAGRLLGRQRGGERLGAGPLGRFERLGRLVGLAQQPAQYAFSHDTPLEPALASLPQSRSEPSCGPQCPMKRASAPPASVAGCGFSPSRRRTPSPASTPARRCPRRGPGLADRADRHPGPRRSDPSPAARRRRVGGSSERCSR